MEGFFQIKASQLLRFLIKILARHLAVYTLTLLGGVQQLLKIKKIKKDNKIKEKETKKEGKKQKKLLTAAAKITFR